ASPYSWSWNTTTATNAAHVVTSKAYDAAANVGTSTVVNVTVNNLGDITPPTTPSNLTAGSAKRKITLTWTASTDNVGVTGYQIWRATTSTGPFAQIATSTSTTYTNNGITSGSTFFYNVK